MVRYLLLTIFLLLTKVVVAQDSVANALLSKIQNGKEDTLKVNNLRDLSTRLGETNEYQKAVSYGYEGIELSRKLKFTKGAALGFLRLGYVTANRGDLAIAGAYYDTAVILSREVGDANLSSLVFLNRGDTYVQLHNLEMALKDCDSALHYAEKANNNDRRARVFQVIGMIYLVQDDYNNSRLNTRKALKIYQASGNMIMYAKALNNIGLSYKYEHDSRNAIKTYNEGLHVADSLNDKSLLAMYYGNIAFVYVENKAFKEALPFANKTRQLAEEIGDPTQLWLAYAVSAEINLGLKNYPKAIEDGLQAYKVSEAMGNISNMNNISDLLAEAYAKSGDYKKGYEYATQSKRLQDSLSKMEYSDQIAGLQTSLNIAQKDKEIILLNKDKEFQKQQIKQHQLITFGSLIAILLTVFTVVLLINRYRISQRLRVLELRNKIAAVLHDEVGSSMSSIRMLSEIARNQPSDNTFLKDLLGKISNNAYETVEKMSDIVWMVRPDYDDTGNMLQRMLRFMDEMCSPLGIAHNLSAGDIEKVKLSMPQRKNLYLIFKEAINNAAKYSESSMIEVGILIKDKIITLTINDNGKGFDEKEINAGNGLNNMRQRAKELGGNLLLQSMAGKGTQLQLTFRIKEA